MTYQDAQRKAYYSQRIGKVYGCFEVTNVEYDEASGKQLWTMQCVHCGRIRYTRNGRDYVKGKNPGTCKCQRTYLPRARKPVEKKISVPKQKSDTITHHELYRRWLGIKARCYNPANKDFRNYGARGITVCDEWRNNFWAFAEWAYANGYSPALTIDRIDNDKGYGPDNCRWVDRAQQNRNKRGVSVYDGYTIPQICEKEGISYDVLKRVLGSGCGIEHAVSEAHALAEKREHNAKCRSAGISVETIQRRMGRGFTFDEAFEMGHDRLNGVYAEINGVRKSLKEWCDEYGVLAPTVSYRMRVKGMTLEEALTAPKHNQGRPKKDRINRG